ncbi:docking protein 3 [Cololabis saira]|uniref:docking protein 3 n=1 Tax=Cololabis saira TaxID=129043 RepID=UPI002AD1D7E4|nr:docking protein 3 [Cololabis saira]
MDTLTKSGKVYLRPLKPTKKWKPVWLSLFPPCSSGVGRLEIKDMGGGDHSPGVRRHHQVHGDRRPKVVRLSELISVLRLPPNAEACPMDNMSAFCVETQDRTMVFAALKEDCVDWVDRLCQSSFKTGSGSGSAQVHVEENHIYASADELSQFEVVIQRTDAATRCGLQGSFWLQVGQEALLLREQQTKNIVLKWPYELLRRFGIDKLAFTIEAGRRCESGPGPFCFETQQAEKIFSLIQSTIKHKTSTSTGHQIQEDERVLIVNKRSHSPLPPTFDMTNLFATLENKLRRSPVFTDRSPTQDDLVGRSECAPAPITLMPLPLVPTHDRSRGGDGQSDGIYADPECCIPTIQTPNTTPNKGLYIDPASVLPLNPPVLKVPDTLSLTSSVPDPNHKTDVRDSVYSEVLDKIHPEQKKQSDLPSTFPQTSPFANDEPIYTEPTRETEELFKKTETKPDPFAHLYAKVCKTPPSCGPSSTGDATPSTSTSSVTSSVTTAAGDPLDDVIYENLGII